MRTARHPRHARVRRTAATAGILLAGWLAAGAPIHVGMILELVGM